MIAPKNDRRIEIASQLCGIGILFGWISERLDPGNLDALRTRIYRHRKGRIACGRLTRDCKRNGEHGIAVSLVPAISNRYSFGHLSLHLHCHGGRPGGKPTLLTRLLPCGTGLANYSHISNTLREINKSAGSDFGEKKRMNQKRRVAILFGGRSAEHEVSLQSARNILCAIDREKYDPVLIGIDKDGKWYLNDASLSLLNDENAALTLLNRESRPVSFVAGDDPGSLVSLDSASNSQRPVDVIFPVLHGPDGEDGTVQGLARLVGVPCVSADVLGSAIAMDKDVAKRLLLAGGLRVARFVTLRDGEIDNDAISRIEVKLGYPVFVKPANLGSSVGVSRAISRAELKESIASAFDYDDKVLVEAAVVGREIECSVLGNNEPIVSLPGEVVPGDGFYSYERKYIDENGAALIIPAKLDESTTGRIREVALESFKILEGRGMARVDLFLTPEGEVYVNEVNTIPGFTRNSMYPKLWEASGLSFTALIDRLIEYAVEDFGKRQLRKRTRDE